MSAAPLPSGSVPPAAPGALAARQPAPLRSAFSTDPRVEFNTATAHYEYEDGATGETFEWIEGEGGKGVWLPVLSEEQVRAQQAAYSVKGVDEEVGGGREEAEHVVECAR